MGGGTGRVGQAGEAGRSSSVGEHDENQGCGTVEQADD